MSPNFVYSMHRYSVVTLDHVVLDTVENVEPHGGTKKLSTPFLAGQDMRLRGSGVAEVLGNVMGSHGVVSDENGWLRKTRASENTRAPNTMRRNPCTPSGASRAERTALDPRIASMSVGEVCGTFPPQ